MVSDYSLYFSTHRIRNIIPIRQKCDLRSHHAVNVKDKDLTPIIFALSWAEKVFLFTITIILTVSLGVQSTYALSNTEDIRIAGSGTVYGLGPTPEHVDNSGNLSVTATGLDTYAYGICSTGGVYNSGNIRAMATGNGIFTRAYGIFSDGFVTNTGNINATTTSSGGSPAIADVYAIRTASAVNNSGAGFGPLAT
jgi:hypothetical protein